jgi:CelD/BcsL family acetyltransferase involved in cellulose biosynthesis
VREQRSVAGKVSPSRVVRTSSELSDVIDGWRDLAARSELSYFSTPDWVLSWWETIGREAEAKVAVWEGSSGSVEAVVPLARIRERLHSRTTWTFPAWTNMGFGAGNADHCGFAVAPHLVDSVRAWIVEKAASGAVILRNLDPSSGVPFVPASARRISTTRCPRLHIPPPDGHLGRTEGSLRRARTYARRLNEAGVRFRWVPPERMNESLLEVLFELHRSRQAMKGHPSAFDAPGKKDLHRRMLTWRRLGAGPAAVVGERDDVPVAVLYGFLWQDVFAYVQAGWDPGWAGKSLGLVLCMESIRLARMAGAGLYDFLRGAEEYKYRFGATDRVDETWIVPGGLLGRLSHLKYRLRGRSSDRGDGT